MRRCLRGCTPKTNEARFLAEREASSTWDEHNLLHALSGGNICQYERNGGIVLKQEASKCGAPSLAKNPAIQSDVYRNCLNHSDYMYERILKRKSKKLGRRVVAKKIRISKKQLFKRYTNQ